MENLAHKVAVFLSPIYGFGSGSGYGDGDGYGYGDGYGSGCNIVNFNGHPVYNVDDVQTVFFNVRGNVARGAILNQDFTMTPVFIARVGDSFAHGDSVELAVRDATLKHNSNLPTEDRIQQFLERFDLTETHLARDLIQGHRMLTGSCETGCLAFVKNSGLTLDSRLTIQEFIERTRDQYGSDVIRELELAVKEKTE